MIAARRSGLPLLVLGFAVTVWCAPASALDPSLAITQYSLSVWTTDEGLPQDTIRDLAQTPDGFLWFGTQAGLVRFDGVQFRVFDRRSDLAFDNHHIYALAVDTRGDLWIGTNGGGLLRRRDGRFEPLPVESISTGRITALEAGPDGTMWIGTYGDGLLHYDPRRPQGERFETFKGPRGLAHEVIFDLAVDAEGSLWIGTYGGGAQRLAHGRFETFDVDDGLADNGVWAVQPSADGTVWIGSNGGLDRLRDGRLEALVGDQGLPRERIIALLEDLEGNLWIGTYGGGLSRRRSDGSMDHLRQPQGLAGDVIWSLFEDREGTIWAGSLGKGLTRLRAGAFKTFGTNEGLSSNITSVLYFDKRGDLWVGTRGAGLNIHRRDSDDPFQFETFGRPDGLAVDGVWDLVEDAAGNFWFATNGDGVQRLDPGGRWRRWTVGDGLADNVVFELLEDSRGGLWFGTNGGLSYFGGGTMTSLTVDEGLPTNQIRELKEDGNGNLWVGTTGGLCRIALHERPQDQAQRLTGEGFECFSTQDGLSSNNIWAIHEDPQGILWLGTAGGGLVRFDGTSFFPLTTREGLYDDEVTVILEDQLGYFWLGTSRGVFRVRRLDIEDFVAGRSSKVDGVTFGPKDGVKNTAGHSTGMVSGDGRVWFAHVGGYSVVDPADLYTRPAPRVLIEQVRVDGEDLTTEGVNLPPSSRDFEFHFTAPTLALPERVKFRYRLLGFDDAWSEAPRRDVLYSFLDAGDYRFEVMASDSQGVWNGVATGFAFQVEPPFYRTSTFFWMMLLAALGVILGAQELRVRGLRQRESELNQRVDESLARLKILRGLLPVCSSCHKVREKDGTWQPIERYIHEHSEASMSHSVCPDCAEALYPGIFEHPDG